MTTAKIRPVSQPEAMTLTTAQRDLLLAARAWWQEGDHALDYLAERSRHEARLAQIRPLLADLRALTDPPATQVAHLLPLLRGLSANRALNRSRETDGFARLLRTLLFGDDPLPARLDTFFASRPGVGPQTVSQFLYAAFPDRYPLVSDATKAAIAPSPAQRRAARADAGRRYEIDPSQIDRATATLLSDFVLYETVRETLGVESFVDVNAILWHAREMPTRGKNRKRGKTSDKAVKETSGEGDYQTASTGSDSETSESELLALLEAEIGVRGFTFPPLTIRDYYIALKTKPFVIFSGLSGTGKTALTRLFAEAMAGESSLSEQYLLVPVRPDWTDGTALLGYYNLLTDTYVTTPFLDLLRRAARPENRERAFFVCLDEMNLARVEHYFADLLSAMETPPPRTIPLGGPTPLSAPLPPNVFLTGSVNTDEATFPFSRKVLDRANTLVFRDVVLDSDPSAARETPLRAPVAEVSTQRRQRIFLQARVETFAQARERLRDIDATFPERILTILTELNALLEPRGLHFGYRVRDEIMRYAANAFNAEEGHPLLGEDPEANLRLVLDLQIVQKVLPRLTGTYEAVGATLIALETWAVDFPRTRATLAGMRRRAAEEGLVTFHEF